MSNYEPVNNALCAGQPAYRYMAGTCRRHFYGDPIPGTDAGVRQPPVVHSHSGCRASYPGGSAGYRSNAGHSISDRYPSRPCYRPRAGYPPRPVHPGSNRYPHRARDGDCPRHPGSPRYPHRYGCAAAAHSHPGRNRCRAAARRNSRHSDADPASAAADVSAPLLTPTPEPQPLRSIGNWQIYAKTYGDHTLAYAENQAIEYETDANPPILTYQCFRGQSSLFIEWHQRLFTRSAPAVEHRAQNPFEESYDNNLDALVDYARELHSYISKERVLTDYHPREVDDIWTDITRERNPDHDTPEALIETWDLRSHRDLLIELSVTHENLADANNPNRKFRIPPHYNSDYNWLVRSESRVQLYYGQVGSLKPALRKSDYPSGSNPDVTLAAIIKEPYQHADIAARWDVGGFRSVDVHIRDECQ